MDDSRNEKAKVQPRLLRYYEWSLAVGWTAVIAMMIAISIQHENTQAYEAARTQALSNFQRDIVYRHWNASSGPVYVKSSPKIPPNPNLADLPERDLVTTGGVTLTMVNPAYMSRLIFESASETFNIKGHLTSLTPLRKENAPDEWERSALSAFKKGTQEATTVVSLNESSYLRLIKPLTVEPECLKCHAKQGYRIGDIRGGLSVAVPMDPLLDLAGHNKVVNSASFAALWGLGLTGIFLGSARLRRTIRERDAAEAGMIRLNRELVERTGELETANRELDAFCATVSHDLRSPLTLITGYCQLIRETAPENHLETCDSYTEVILSSTKKMEGLITTLLNFSRVTRGKIDVEEVDLGGIAQEIAAELQLRDRGRRATFTIAQNLAARGDEGLLRVVMENLIGNAWKYSGEQPETRIEVGKEVRGDGEVYFVRDNGIGFDKEESDLVFEAFQRLPNAKGFQGTGIGLATVKRIVARHGGEIGCEGEPGKGALFYFSLPG